MLTLTIFKRQTYYRVASLQLNSLLLSSRFQKSEVLEL